MPDSTETAQTVTSTSASSPAETVTTPVAPAAPVAPTAPVTSSVVVTSEGQPNGLPPAAPGVAHEPATEVIKLREWFHEHVMNSVHSQDTAHYNSIFQHIEAVIAKLQSKHPVTKES